MLHGVLLLDKPLGHRGDHLFAVSGLFALQNLVIDAFADVPTGQRERAVDGGDRLRLSALDDLPQIRQKRGAWSGERINGLSAGIC